MKLKEAISRQELKNLIDEWVDVVVSVTYESKENGQVAYMLPRNIWEDNGQLEFHGPGSAKISIPVKQIKGFEGFVIEMLNGDRIILEP